MSRRPTHFQLLSHRFARPQDLLVILLAGPDQGTGECFSEPPIPVQEPRKIPQMIHQNCIGFQNPKNSSNFPQKSLHFIQPKKSIKTHQIFLQNPQKVAAQKKSTKNRLKIEFFNFDIFNDFSDFS
jgi:hypothetical protein